MGRKHRVDVSLGDRIAAWRRRAGLTQVDLAEKLDLYDSSSVSRWESNQQEPSQKNLRAIVDVLGITFAEFYGEVPAEAKAG
jgi:transcriptional regulator with XRE-family HTH domain